jgi:ABC-type transport system substrate-binding protein
VTQRPPRADRRRLLQGAVALSAWPAMAAAPEPGAATGNAARPGTEKVLRLAFPAPESSFDPPQTNSDLYSTTLIAHILEAPLGYDYLARPARLLPITAAALPEVSADGRRFTVRIKPGIHFADDPAFKGVKRELVAEDYVYSIKRFYDPRYNSSDLYLFEQLKLPGLSELRQQALKGRRPFDYDTPVDGVRALDRYTFQVTLGDDDPRFVYRFADPSLMGAVAREVVEFYGDDIGAHPVGTGAFRLRSWRRASRIELERSPTYRETYYEGTPAADPIAQGIAARLKGRRLPCVDRVIVDIVEEDQPRWLSFLDGSYDFLLVPGRYATIAAPQGRLAPFLDKRGVRLQRVLNADMTMNFFYMEDPIVGGYALHQVALRRAIGLAHDGEAYIRQIFGGNGIPAQSTIAPHTSGYDPGYRSEMSTYDPARARALLDLHGYADRDGDGWRELPDGRPLRLRVATLGDQRSRSSNDLMRRNLAAVGLRVDFEVSTWPELLKKSRAGTLQMWGYAWSASSPDGGFFLGIAYGPNASEANDARFSLPAFDELFRRQLRLPDGPERAAVMREAQNLLAAYLPYKVLVHRVLTDLVQPWTQHYWRHPFMRDIWRFVDVDRR